MNTSLLYNRLYHWYEVNHRVLPWRETVDPYRIWVSEIILQQTRVVQGMEYYVRFIARFPDVQSLASAEEDEVLRYWQGLGYYTRARNLHKAARMIAGTSGEVGGVAGVDNPTQQERFAALRAMPGVGEYTAGAIASFAFDLPYPALDGNVYRVLSRLYDCDIAFDTSAGKRHFHSLAEGLLDTGHPRLFNSAIMEFGALYCVPQSPDCEGCPLQECCLAYAHHTVALLPIRKVRGSLRERYLNYTLYITRAGETLIHQRVADDIWKHLYEFPLVESDRLLPVGTCPSIDLTHVLSHQRLHARFHVEEVAVLPDIPETRVVRIEEIEEYAMSRLTMRALEGMGVVNGRLSP